MYYIFPKIVNKKVVLVNTISVRSVSISTRYLFMTAKLHRTATIRFLK